jgi:hypothetical protein
MCANSAMSGEQGSSPVRSTGDPLQAILGSLLGGGQTGAGHPGDAQNGLHLGSLLQGLLGGGAGGAQASGGQGAGDLGSLLGGGAGDAQASGGQGAGDLGSLLGGLLGGGAEGVQASGGQGAGDLGSLLGGLLGGGAGGAQASGGQGAGDLSSLLGGLLGGGAGAPGASMGPVSGSASSPATAIATALAEKLGLPPQMAQMVVSFVLGRLLISGRSMGVDLGSAGGRAMGLNNIAQAHSQSTDMAQELAQYTGLDPETSSKSLTTVLDLLGSQTAPQPESATRLPRKKPANRASRKR